MTENKTSLSQAITTITGLNSGLHYITVYANDTFGNMGASENVGFNIAASEPFQIAFVAVSVIAVVVVAAGLLVYFKKRTFATHRLIEGEIT